MRRLKAPVAKWKAFARRGRNAFLEWLRYEKRLGDFRRQFQEYQKQKNLLEVIEIQFEEMKELGTLYEFLLEAGYKSKDEIVESEKEIIGFDKSFVVLEHVA